MAKHGAPSHYTGKRGGGLKDGRSKRNVLEKKMLADEVS